MPRITRLNLYPVKGMRSIPLPELRINASLGVEGDRQKALIRTPLPEPDQWAPKNHFYVGMNTARMVSLFPDSPIPHEKLTQDKLDLVSLPSAFYARDRFNLTDTKGPTASLLNLATYRLFEEFLHEGGHLPKDQWLNPERFRMNVQVDGWEPFAELDLADSFPGSREIMLGNCRFVVDDACERCKATHANPDTGEYDLKTVPLLMQFMAKHRPDYKSPHRGVKSVMGLILVPLESGVLHRNDTLRII